MAGEEDDADEEALKEHIWNLEDESMEKRKVRLH